MFGYNNNPQSSRRMIFSPFVTNRIHCRHRFGWLRLFLKAGRRERKLFNINLNNYKLWSIRLIQWIDEHKRIRLIYLPEVIDDFSFVTIRRNQSFDRLVWVWFNRCYAYLILLIEFFILIWIIQMKIDHWEENLVLIE